MSEKLLCPITGEDISVHYEYHHIIPIEYGGNIDGDLIKLSPTGHRLLHLQAEAFSSKKPKKQYYMTTPQLENNLIKILISSIIRAKNSYNRSIHSRQERKLMIHIPDFILAKLHKAKMDSGFTNIEKYILKLIIDDIKNKKL